MIETTDKETPAPANQDWALIDVVRRALVAGAGALFMTEEGIRSFLGDLKLPKDAINFVLSQVARSKQDLFQLLGQELRGFLESVDLVEQARQLLSSLDIKIEAKIKISPRRKAAGHSRHRSGQAGEDKSSTTPAKRGKKVADQG